MGLNDPLKNEFAKFVKKDNYMKKSLLLLSLVCILFASCTKSTSSSVSPLPVAAYSVSGISDMYMSENNYHANPIFMPLSFKYNDSAEQNVSVSVSGYPSFMIYGTNTGATGSYPLNKGPWTGIPDFSLSFEFYFDYYYGTYVAGTYPITITCTNASGASKHFTFNLYCQ